MSIDLYFSIKDNATPVLKQIMDTAGDLTSAFEDSQKKVSQYEDELVDLKMGMSAATKTAREMQKVFEKTQTDEDKQAWRKAAKEVEEYRGQISKTTKILNEYRGAYDTLAEAVELAGNKQSDMVSKLNNRVSAASSGGRGGGGTLSTLGKSGAIAAAGNMLAPAMQDLAGSLLSSSMDSTSASYISDALGGALSGAGTGAAIGSMFGPIGTAIGGAAGAIFGGLTSWISSWSKEQEEINNAYKDVVKGLTDSSFEKSEEMMQTGIALASSREQIKVSFKSLLKNGQEANALYNDVREMSNQTPYTFDQLAGVSRYLAVSFKTSDEIMDWLNVIGDAAASVGASESDMQEMTRALTKIKNSGKASREDLDMWSDRGINVYDMLSKQMGISQGSVYEQITKGNISADTVFSAIQKYAPEEFGGGMKMQSGTYGGLVSTLEGLKADRTEGAFGTAYEDAMKPVLEKQIAWYEGEKGKALEEMYAEKGKFQARLESDQIESQLKANEEAIANYQAIAANMPKNPLDTLFDSVIQKGDQASGVMQNFNTALSAAQGFTGLFTSNIFDVFGKKQEQAASTLLQTIDIKTEVNYSQTEAFTLQNEIKKTVLDYAQIEVQKNPILYETEIAINKKYSEGKDSKHNEESYWNKFIADANSQTHTIHPTVVVEPKIYTKTNSLNYDISGLTTFELRQQNLEKARGNGHASGLTRVPYDNYPALLHQGERVLTAQETRQADRASGGINVTIAGNTFTVRSDDDVKRIAEAFVKEVQQAALIQGS